MDVLAQWLPSQEASSANHTSINVVAFWEAQLPIHMDDDLIGSLGYERVGASHLRLTIGVKDMHVLIRKERTAAWGQLWISRISLGLALQTSSCLFGAITKAARFCLSSLFTVSPISTARYLAGAA